MITDQVNMPSNLRQFILRVYAYFQICKKKLLKKKALIDFLYLR